MEYALFALALFLMFSLIAVILYVTTLSRIGIEEYDVGGISVRRKWFVDLKPYDREVRCIITALKGGRFLYRVLEDKRWVFGQLCVVLSEDLHANNQKCIGLASRLFFMSIPTDGMRRFVINIDIASVRSKSLSYDQIEGLLRHEFGHHWIWLETGKPDPHHMHRIWSDIK